jgi:hypothetical protein
MTMVIDDGPPLLNCAPSFWRERGERIGVLWRWGGSSALFVEVKNDDVE